MSTTHVLKLLIILLTKPSVIAPNKMVDYSSIHSHIMHGSSVRGFIGQY